MSKTKTKKKKWGGVRTDKASRPELVGDSYQADKADLQMIREIAKKCGCSKAEIIRYGIKLAIQVHHAHEEGKDSVQLVLRPNA